MYMNAVEGGSDVALMPQLQNDPDLSLHLRSMPIRYRSLHFRSRRKRTLLSGSVGRTRGGQKGEIGEVSSANESLFQRYSDVPRVSCSSRIDGPRHAA